MRQTLFVIPAELFGIPLFGFGLVLGLWALLTGAAAWVIYRRTGGAAEILRQLPVMLLVGAGIWLAPRVIDVAGGLPVRGFGAMMLLAVCAAVGLAVYRARQMRVDPEVVLSLAFWIFLPGIVGARLYYIAKNWRDFRRLDDEGSLDFTSSLAATLDVTEGGLVVYGAVIAGAVGYFAFVRRHRLPALALGDLIAPSLMFGLALGRVGCFLNGCCYGGVCDAPWAVTFPEGQKLPGQEYARLSPPYSAQMEAGLIPHGVRLEDRGEGPPAIAEIVAGSPAAKSGLQQGDRVARINGLAIESAEQARRALLQLSSVDNEVVVLIAGSDAAKKWTVPAAPSRSLPVHPTQLYAALDALLIGLFLLAYYPYRRRDGEVVAWLMTLYGAARLLEESIRSDVPHVLRLGFVALNDPQVISLLVLSGGIVLFAYLWPKSRGSAFERSPGAGERWAWELRSAA